ncbi:helix-turn-helix domain-containing protein [Streptomyces hoynatensis]|uniref:XRE family transcriptional regulator n=1 Tax=Streptomyces hoynatensis TaxID=1141874 RepID=A0A3A9ZCA8_9ACTN|nr:helix-turn-helix transcriptional regulator [Streptomyces hoynatensis]RKN45749.1 XRE family transcriptional regulator [Streptomyces hoynatensis]
MMDADFTIGDRIARFRAKRKLTQEQLAERSGLSVDVVRKLEQGQRQTARLTTLNALAATLDVEPSVLMGHQPGTFEVRAEGDSPSVLALPMPRRADHAAARSAPSRVCARRARFHVDQALAHAELQDDAHAVRALLAAEATAPEWMRYHATSRRLTAELLTRERRRTSPVRELAERLHLDD